MTDSASHEGAGLHGPAPEGVLRPLPRAHADEASPTGSTRLVRIATSLYSWIFFRGARDRAPTTCPPSGPVIIAPNHFSLHGPLLQSAMYMRRRVRFMAKSQLFKPADAVDLQATAACSRCGAGTADEEAFITAKTVLDHGRHGRHVLRGRPLAHRRAVGQAEARHRPACARDRRAGRADRDLRLGEGAQLEAPAVPEGHGPVRRADPASSEVETRRASSSRRSPTRSSPRSARSTRARGRRPQGHGAARARAAPRGTRGSARSDGLVEAYCRLHGGLVSRRPLRAAPRRRRRGRGSRGPWGSRHDSAGSRSASAGTCARRRRTGSTLSWIVRSRYAASPAASASRSRRRRSTELVPGVWPGVETRRHDPSPNRSTGRPKGEAPVTAVILEVDHVRQSKAWSNCSMTVALEDCRAAHAASHSRR